MAEPASRGDAGTGADRPVGGGATGSGRERPPGPDGYPVVGNLPSFVRAPLDFLDRVVEYGDVARYRLLDEEVYALSDPDLVERVLVTDDDRFRKGEIETEIVSNVAETSVVVTEGTQWRRQRTAIQPAFTMDRIRAYASTMADYAAGACEEWAAAGVVDADARATDLTLRILAKSVFDVDVADGHDAVAAAARGLNERMDPTGVSARLPPWVPTPTNVRYVRAMRAFDGFVDDLIERRSADPAEHDDLLAMLLAARADGDLTDREVRDQVKTFLFAGHETTATAITFACFALGNHPEKRRELREEVDAVLDGDRPTLEDVFELEYTGRVVDEVLRRYPPVTGVFREPVEDVTIGGYEVPAGTTVFLPTYQIHADDRFYDEPDAFRPERWADDAAEDRPEYAYFPFGGGPRHCVGMRFARMELKVVLATLARKTTFEALTGRVDPTVKVTLEPDRPIEVAVEAR
jgi:cytochrome P450